MARVWASGVSSLSLSLSLSLVVGCSDASPQDLIKPILGCVNLPKSLHLIG